MVHHGLLKSVATSVILPVRSAAGGQVLADETRTSLPAYGVDHSQLRPVAARPGMPRGLAVTALLQFPVVCVLEQSDYHTWAAL